MNKPTKLYIMNKPTSQQTTPSHKYVSIMQEQNVFSIKKVDNTALVMVRTFHFCNTEITSVSWEAEMKIVSLASDENDSI